MLKPGQTALMTLDRWLQPEPASLPVLCLATPGVIMLLIAVRIVAGPAHLPVFAPALAILAGSYTLYHWTAHAGRLVTRFFRKAAPRVTDRNPQP